MRAALAGLIVVAAGATAPMASAEAADFGHLRALAGQYSDVVLADPVLAAELRQNLGAGYSDFVEAMQVVVPSELIDNRFLMISGCMQHDCDAHRGLVLVDLEGGGIQVLRSDLYGPSIPVSARAEAAMDARTH